MAFRSIRLSLDKLSKINDYWSDWLLYQPSPLKMAIYDLIHESSDNK